MEINSHTKTQTHFDLDFEEEDLEQEIIEALIEATNNESNYNNNEFIADTGITMHYAKEDTGVDAGVSQDKDTPALMSRIKIPTTRKIPKLLPRQPVRTSCCDVERIGNFE